MSISNIFDCCKKTEILLGISGIVLGTYATNAFLKSPISVKNPIINIIDTGRDTFVAPIRDYIKIHITDPISYFTAFMNSTRVFIASGLAYITLSNGVIVAISAASYYTLKILLNRLFTRTARVLNYANTLGEGSFIGRSIKSQLNVEKYRNLSKTQMPPSSSSFSQSEKEREKEKIEKDPNIKDRLRELKKFQYKNLPAKDFRNRHKKKTIEGPEEKKTPAPGSFFDFTGGKSGNVIYFFDEPNILPSSFSQSEEEKKEKESDIIKIEEIDEKEEINDSLKKIEEDEKKIEEIINSTEVYTDMELYKNYIEIIKEELKEKKIQVEIKEIDDNFNNMNIPFQANLQNQFSLDISFNPSENINNLERLYQVSYQDLQNFLSYGNMILEGDVNIINEDDYLNIDPSLEIQSKEKIDITYENLSSLFILNFKAKTFLKKIIDFYIDDLLILLAALKKEGISKYSSDLEVLFTKLQEFDILDIALKNNIFEFKKDEKERYKLLVTKLENKLIYFKPTEEIKKGLKTNDNYIYNENLSFFQNILKIPRYRMIIENIDREIYKMVMKTLSIKAIIKIINNIYLNLHNK